MTVLSAQSIRRLCLYPRDLAEPLISPFTEDQHKHFGLSGASYDVRIAQTVWVWPLFGRLACTMERFCLPGDVVAEVKDKSSLARSFVLVQNTFINSGWRGYLTLELTRDRPWPRRIKAGTPIAQIVFTWLDESTGLPYRGKYQNQGPAPKSVF